MMDTAPDKTIGALAGATGSKVETIRYYERIGLLPEPARSPGGNRLYGPETVKRLNFIRRARGLGFNLNAVRVLLGVADGRGKSCAEVEGIATAHLDDVRGKLADLRKLERVLADMVAECRGGTLPECPVIEALYEPAPRQPQGGPVA